MNLVQEFQKRASAAGLSNQQIEAFIGENGLAAKLATEQTPADVYNNILAAAQVEKSAEALAYVESFTSQALSRGLSAEQACELAKQAVAAAFRPTPEVSPEKKAEADAYTAGLLEKAAELGFTQDEAINFLQKAAGAMDMFKTLGKGVAAGGAGAGAGYLAGKYGPQISQQLQALPGNVAEAAKGVGDVGRRFVHNQFSQSSGASDMLTKIKALVSQNPQLATILTGAAGGGLAGGLTGAVPDPQDEQGQGGETHMLRNALLGSLAGGGLAAGGYGLAKQQGLI